MNDLNRYFKVSRRQYRDAALIDFGFKPYKSSYLGRLTNDNIFQFIEFIKYRFGGQFKVVIAIRPLFCQNNSYLTTQPGNTLDFIATNGKSDRWWLSTDQNVIDQSLKDVSRLINLFAIPFFSATTRSEDIIKSKQRNLFCECCYC